MNGNIAVYINNLGFIWITSTRTSDIVNVWQFDISNFTQGVAVSICVRYDLIHIFWLAQRQAF